MKKLSSPDIQSFLASLIFMNRSLESNGEQKFRCEICKIETSNQAGLDQHISGKNHQKKVAKLGVENGKGPFRCEICDVNASNQAALDLHLIGRAHRFQIENL